MKVTSKRYVVSTSALNCYGYRVLTKGIDLAQFLKNPVLFWMHKKDYSPGPNDKMIPLGRAEEIKVEGDEITCQLAFSESNPFAMLIYAMYEDGTLNMLSLGALPMEASVEPADLVEGQTGPTITKCKALEFSCVDIGGNDDAIACQLFDAEEKPIELKGINPEGVITLFNSLQILKTDNTINMKLIQLSGAALSNILLGLNLQETATEVEVQSAVQNLIALSAGQKNQIATLTTEKETLQGKVASAEAKVNEQIKLANEAKLIQLYADKGILPEQQKQYNTLAEGNFDGTIALLSSMPTSVSLSQALNKGQNGKAWYIELSYDQMDKSGQLAQLKAENLDAFKEKFKIRFGKEYKG